MRQVAASGFLGQTNVGHRVNDPAVAQRYLDYWNLLSADPQPEDLKPAVEDLSPGPGNTLPANSMTCEFSPRTNVSLLTWYADRIRGSREAALFTGAFGVNETLAEAFSGKRDFVRFLLLEKPPSLKTQGKLGKDRGMIVVYGNVLGQAYEPNKKGELTRRRNIPRFKLEEWFLHEEHFRKRGHIFFIHTKILMIDPLSNDPLIFSGSANFSESSLRANDENMLLIRV